MKKLSCWLFVVAFVLSLVATPQTVYAAGSFLDTLHQTQEGQADDGSLAPTEESTSPSVEPEPAPAEPAISDGQVAFNCQGMSLEQLIQNIIRQVMSQMGCRGIPIRIIIIRNPGSCPGTQPPTTGGSYPGTTTPPPTTTNPPTSTTPPATTTPPQGTTDGQGVAGLKAEMSAKYGIKAVDGDGAVWSQRQLEEANKVLSTLPEEFRKCTKNIQRDAMFHSPNVLGYVQMGIPTVHLLNSCCQMGTFQGTLVHEMTHTFQAYHPDITRMWQQTFWANGRSPSPPSVSGYGNTQPVEDMAESVRQYWQAGSYMKQTNPQRYEFVKKYIMGGKEF